MFTRHTRTLAYQILLPDHHIDILGGMKLKIFTLILHVACSLSSYPYKPWKQIANGTLMGPPMLNARMEAFQVHQILLMHPRLV